MQLSVPKAKLKPLLKAVETAYKKLHSRKGYKPEDIADIPEFSQVVLETNRVLSGAITDNDITPGMRRRLREDVFLFSGLKTHAELFEASRQLVNADGNFKSFNQFERDIKGVKASHRKYLEAEYEFAVNSVQSAEKWESFSDSDRYYLQYRTAGDDRVRDTHDALRDITLPKNHEFWTRYTTPNGWRCRCVIVQVLATLNEMSNGANAMAAGEKATTQYNKNGQNKLEIFRFNPGTDKVAFPPNHPYQKVKGAANAKTAIRAVGAANAGINGSGFKEVKKYKNGGAIYEHVEAKFEKRDYDNIMRTAKAMARDHNAVVELLPNPHEKSLEYQGVFAELKDTDYWGKKPDLRIDGKFYEHEGFETTNMKRAISNMLKRGLKQSDRIIIEDTGISVRGLRERIRKLVVLEGKTVSEVWVKRKKGIERVY